MRVTMAAWWAITTWQMKGRRGRQRRKGRCWSVPQIQQITLREDQNEQDDGDVDQCRDRGVAHMPGGDRFFRDKHLQKQPEHIEVKGKEKDGDDCAAQGTVGVFFPLR